MAKAELSYNPYLLETNIRFNGKKPRINSLVETFQGVRLQEWIKDLPGIFHDEMNGYDFELEFSGTAQDYEEIRKSFRDGGVTDKMVHFFHKNELEGRLVKCERIEALLSWLEQNPNRRFDNRKFREDNSTLFDDAYIFVLICSGAIEISLFKEIEVRAESFEKASELEKTNLRDTPVVFYVDESQMPIFQRNLMSILDREDIIQDQIFFILAPGSDSDRVRRVIMDLGVEKPQITSLGDDSLIKRYMELFPITEYIGESIKVFRTQAEGILTVLQEENAQAEKENREIHDRINALEDRIARLKFAGDLFRNRDNIEMPHGFLDAKKYFLQSIETWRNFKTKVSKEAEALYLAAEFEKDYLKAYQTFLDNLKKWVEVIREETNDAYRRWYTEPETDVNYAPCMVEEDIIFPDAPAIKMDLAAIKEEAYVVPKEDLFSQLFKGNASSSQEPVLETTYPLAKWRSFVMDIAAGLADESMDLCFRSLTDTFEKTAAAYEEHLTGLIALYTEEKDKTTSQLSEDEKVLQADNDWITKFCDQIREIERT